MDAASIPCMNEEDGIKARIEQRLKDLGLSPRAASLKAGGSPDLIRGLLRGNNKTLRGDNLMAVARVLGVSVEWLQSGEHEHIPSEEVAAALPGRNQRENGGATSLEKYKGEHHGAIPEIDARAGAGPGSVGEHEVVTLQRGEAFVGHKVISEWVFPDDYLRHEMRARPGALISLEVIGDSMSPTVESGDRVFVDTSYQRPSPDGVYVIDEGDGPMVKRVQMIRRSEPLQIRIISDNKNHETYTLRLDDVRVIGRVAGRLTTM